MYRLSLIILLTVSISLGWTVPPTLDIPREVIPNGQYCRFTPKTDAVSVLYIGLSNVDSFPSEDLKDNRRFVLDTRGLPEGNYKFAAIASSKDGDQVRQDFTVVIGKPVPVPPDPGPKPPGPTPTGDYRVLMLVESSQLSNYTHTIRKSLYDKPVRDTLNSKCVKVGTESEWNMWDKDSDVSREPKVWQDIFKKAKDDSSSIGKGKLPWVVIVSPKGTYSGPLPEGGTPFIDLLNKY